MQPVWLIGRLKNETYVWQYFTCDETHYRSFLLFGGGEFWVKWAGRSLMRKRYLI
jgi:hypothetical protein